MNVGHFTPLALHRFDLEHTPQTFDWSIISGRAIQPSFNSLLPPSVQAEMASQSNQRQISPLNPARLFTAGPISRPHPPHFSKSEVKDISMEHPGEWEDESTLQRTFSPSKNSRQDIQAGHSAQAPRADSVRFSLLLSVCFCR